MPAWTKVQLIEEDFELNRTGHATGARTYYVEASDSYVDTDLFITATLGGVTVDSWGAPFSARHPKCLAINIKPKRISTNQANVYVNFEDPTLSSALGVSTTIINNAATITIDHEEFEEEYSMDYGNPPIPVVNSAGEPFDRGPVRIRTLTTFDFEKYVDAATADALENALETNNKFPAQIKGRTYPPSTLLFAKLRFDDVGGVTKAYYTIKYKKDLWKDQVLNMGFNEWVGLSPQGANLTAPIFVPLDPKDANSKKVPTTTPWPLNSTGSKKASRLDAPDILQFFPYPENEWAGVPLS